MQLFSKEVKDSTELNEVLKNYEGISKEYKVAVIVFAFDSENRIVFQRRGLGCRDAQLKLESIGGKVESNDIDFRTALKREIKEETGMDSNIELQEFIVSTYAKTYDTIKEKEQDWVYLVYKGNLKSEELRIVEPSKCLGYERYKIGEVNENELSEGAKETYNIVRKKYSYLK